MARSKIGISCIACLVVGLAFDSQLRAGVVATATLVKDPANGIPFEGAEAALGAPWVSYLLELREDFGDGIAAIDFSFSGPLYQRWDDLDGDGTFTATATGNDVVGGDSHLLNPGSALFGFGPLEDNSGVGSPLSDSAQHDYGIGTSLRGAWGFPPASQSSLARLAYVVIPKGSESELDIVARCALPADGGCLTPFDETDFFPQLDTPPIVTDIEALASNTIGVPAGVPSNLYVALQASDNQLPHKRLDWELEGFEGPAALYQPDVSGSTFHWNVIGAPIGVYTATLRATDKNGLSDLGTLTIRVVPEPSGVLQLVLGIPLICRRTYCNSSTANFGNLA